MDANTIGLAAGFLTTASFVPQVVKTWKSRSAKDISLPMFVAFILGISLWIVFGVMESQISIVLWNGVTLILAGAIIAMKLKFG